MNANKEIQKLVELNRDCEAVIEAVVAIKDKEIKEVIDRVENLLKDCGIDAPYFGARILNRAQFKALLELEVTKH